MNTYRLRQFLAVAVFLGLSVTVPVPAQSTRRVSLSVEGGQSNGYSEWSSISADGRYVAFGSDATNLVAADTNGLRDVFVFDRDPDGNGVFDEGNGVTTRVNLGPGGIQALGGDSYLPSLSADGRYVVFHSHANNLVADDTNGRSDIFVHDRDPDGNGIFDEGNGVTTRVNLGPGGIQALGGDSYRPTLSADGRYVVFQSLANNLVADDTNGRFDIFVHDRDPDGNGIFDEGNGVTRRVSEGTGGVQANHDSYWPSINADGRYVAFQSYAYNLCPPFGWRWHVYLHDRDPDGNGIFDEDNGVTTRVSITPGGLPGNQNSLLPTISADSRHVAFFSYASDLVSDDTNQTWDWFVRDLDTEVTARVSVSTGGGQTWDHYHDWRERQPALSTDGRFVVFDSYANTLVGDDTNEYWDVFVCDRDPDGNGTFESEQVFTTRVSVGTNGAEGNYESGWPAVSADGRDVTFISSSNSYVIGDVNQWDIFVHDRQIEGTAVYQPDALVRKEGEPGYRGGGVFNTNGADQTAMQTASGDIPAVYEVVVRNHGNQPDAFRVFAPANAGGWAVTYHALTARGEQDITAEITGPNGYVVPTLAPGSAAVLRVEVTPTGGVPDGALEAITVTASSWMDPAQADMVQAATVAVAPAADPVGRIYTLDADFDEGVLIAVEHETVHDQLQLTQTPTTFPFIWVPNTNEGTISKVDTVTGRELARYRTGPMSYANPSRTTVDLQGNCWVANRQVGTVVKVGLLETGGFVDRNGDGVIQTSRDTNGDGNITGDELLPWGEDECVLIEVALIPGYSEGPYIPGTFGGVYANDYWTPGPRGMAVDASNNVWVGTYGTQKFYHLDGVSGEILRIVDVSLAGHYSYGAVIDPTGILWSAYYDNAGWNRDHVLRLDTSTCRFSTVYVGNHVYSLALDQADHLFATRFTAGMLTRINTATSTVEWSKPGKYNSRGVAVTPDGDVWTADTDVSLTLTRWSSEGEELATIPVGVNPIGVSVDGDGKVWVVNYDDQFVRRIDPAINRIDLSKRILGGAHYGYSDMTGMVSRWTTTRIGNWSVVHDARTTDSPWGTVSWNADLGGGGATLEVKVRSSNDRQTWSAWETAGNDQPLAATPPGRFLQVRGTFQSFTAGVSPVLYDLTVTPAAFVRQPDACIRGRTQVECTGDDVYACAADEQQTVWEHVYNERPGIYLIQIQNDGNFPDEFMVRQTAAAGTCAVTYEDSATQQDITAAVTGMGWSTGPLRAGHSRVIALHVTPDPDTPPGDSCTVSVTATSVGDPGTCDTVTSITVSDGLEPPPACVTYTLCSDFEQGHLIGLACGADQLELVSGNTTFPFIWVPNSNEGTVSKVDTRTGDELGRYRTGPTTAGSPSRTTVDQEGSCWVANRGTGTVVKIGLLENGGYMDRNGNGVIDTSLDLDGDGNITGSELLPWGEDECVLYEIVLIDGYVESTYVPGTYTGSYSSAPVPRAIAVDPEGNIWAGTYGSGRYYRINGATGQILQETYVSHGPYGAVFDLQGMLWSAGAANGYVYRLNPADSSLSYLYLGHWVYGLGLDPQTGRLYVTGWTDSKMSRIDTATSYLEARVPAKYGTRGAAVTDDGDIWTACSWDGTLNRWRTNPITDAPEIIATIPVGDTPTGVAVDADGKVWAVNYGDEYIHRIDPATDTVDLSKRIIGGHHYGYSDMTGIIARIGTGTWTVVHDTRVLDRRWGTVSWNSYEPSADARVTVRVRSSNDQLTWSAWETVTCRGILQSTPPGRFLQVEATLRRTAGSESPVLYDLTVCPAALGDFDGDGNVDLDDYALLADCFGGPDVPLESGCEEADLNTDDELDLADFAVFQRAFSGQAAGALLTDLAPPDQGSLWRTAGNTIRLTFDRDITASTTTQMEIRQMLDGGCYSANLAERFAFTLEDDGGGHPRVLRIRENGTVLSHRTWVAVRNPGGLAGWAGVAPFEVQYVVQVGDVNGDGKVLASDLSAIFPKIPTANAGDQERADVNGDGKVLASDLSAVFPHIPSPSVPKPSGH